MSSIKIDGIDKGYLKTMGIQNPYDILQRFKEIEADIWGGDLPEKEDPTRAFIDGLINIISEIRYQPKGKGKEDAKKEIENANQLVLEVEKLTKGKIISNDSTTTAEIVERLKNKSGDSAKFETLLCCLLMSDSLKKNECDIFSGVFKSWDWLQKLDQHRQRDQRDRELKKLFETETAKINRKRSDNVITGFQRMISLISEDGNKALEMGKLHSFCVKEEAIRDEFYKWLKKCRINRLHFTRCYVSVKNLLPKFTETNDNLEHHLEWEVQEMLRVFRLSRPSFETENGTNRLQKQLANLWNQVKNKLNDPEEWNRFTESESPKVTTPDDATDSSSNHDKLKCLQINLNRSKDAWEELIHQWLDKEKVDVVFIQEPRLKKIGNEQTNDCCYCFPGLPTNYRAVHNNYLMGKDKKSNYDRSAAILVHVDVPFERILPMAALSDNYPTTSTTIRQHPQELMVGIRLTGNGWDGVTLFSIYFRRIRSLALLLKPLRSLGNHDMTRTVLCMDANATHPNWSPDWEDKDLYSGRGEDLEDFRAFCNFQVANKNLEDKRKPIKTRATKENEGDTRDEDKTETNNVPEKNSKHIDVTFYGTKLWIENWKRLEVKSLSDHRYITFSIRNYLGENSKKSSTLLSALDGGSMSCLGRTSHQKPSVGQLADQ